MIISKVPFRISLFGGGSDYPDWYRQRGGRVLSFPIDKYLYLSVRKLPPFFDHLHRVVWSKIELVNSSSEISHPVLQKWLTEKCADLGGLEVIHSADLPARTGLASSSAFIAAVIATSLTLRNAVWDHDHLAQMTIDFEQNVLREAVGIQDAIGVIYGGIKLITIDRGGGYAIDRLCSDVFDRLKSRLMLFYTGISRNSSVIAEEIIKNVRHHRRHLEQIMEFASITADLLRDPNSDLNQIGHMLDLSWIGKKELAGTVSNGKIDAIYDDARRAGALGGKLLGAGGGGFLLLYVEERYNCSVRAALSSLVEVPIDLDEEGARLVLC